MPAEILLDCSLQTQVVPDRDVTLCACVQIQNLFTAQSLSGKVHAAYYAKIFMPPFLIHSLNHPPLLGVVHQGGTGPIFATKVSYYE